MRRLLLFSLSGYPLLDRLFELPSWQHDPALAAQAAKADVCANTVHVPALTPARVYFSHLDDVADLYVHIPRLLARL
jgi:hypothetical protein